MHQVIQATTGQGLEINDQPACGREPETYSIARSLSGRAAILIAVVLPFVGLIVAVALLWGYGFSWLQLVLLVGMYHLTMLGVTLGFHRLFTHRSYETTRWIQVILAVLGSMAVQGPLIKWVAVHRRHHQLSDRQGDPHSPHLHGVGIFGVLRGIWHAHLGLLFERDAPDLYRYVGDLLPDRLLRSVSRLFPLWVVIGLIAPAGVAGLATRSWWGVLLGFLWGGLARVFLVHHTAWSVNSICHLFGRQPFRSADESRNNFAFGVLALGEGWHNNHHAFPTSARHGLGWWQLDATYLVIRALSAAGLAWKVRLPAPQAIAARLQPGYEHRGASGIIYPYEEQG